ncbi:MAG: dienelactone hydrolase family protein [Propionibacteriaceae bacterium]
MTAPATQLPTVTGYLATPVATSDRPGPWPGVVMIHDAFGLGSDAREQADWLAAAGYLTVIPDLYQGKRAVTCIKGTFAQLTARKGPAFDQIESARVALASHEACTGTVGVIGYCMGGGFALVLAGQGGWSAASVNYGMVPEDIRDILSGACPIVASYGGKDRTLPEDGARLEEAATAVGATIDFKEYPEARHGFINRLAAMSPMTPLMKIGGVGYDHDAAADAKKRILSFFDVYLRNA